MAHNAPVKTTWAYLAPFAVFMAFLAINPLVPVPQWARFAIEMVLILTVSREILQMPSRPLASVALGVAVFVVWIGPDQVYPAWRSLPLFSNSITGHAVATTSEVQKHDGIFLLFRVLNSVIAIPILEELFWRGFLMRWLISKKFWAVPLGKYAADAFWIVALLFASEHGPFWDVGLVTGAVYNLWIVKTRNLGDCILAHAVTNGCLAAFVIGMGRWEYWL